MQTNWVLTIVTEEIKSGMNGTRARDLPLLRLAPPRTPEPCCLPFCLSMSKYSSILEKKYLVVSHTLRATNTSASGFNFLQPPLRHKSSLLCLFFFHGGSKKLPALSKTYWFQWIVIALFISRCYIHGIKKLPDYWQTHCYNRLP